MELQQYAYIHKNTDISYMRRAIIKISKTHKNFSYEQIFTLNKKG